MIAAQADEALDFARDVLTDVAYLVREPVLWIPAVALSLSTDILMSVMDWPFRNNLAAPPERSITTMAIVILAKAWFGLTLCQIALARLRGERAGFIVNWVPVTSAIRIGIVCVCLMAAIVAGTLLLVLPGLYLLAHWSQAAMTLLDRRARWFDAASYSASLTDGYKAPIVGMWLVVLLIATGLEAIGSGLGVAPGAQTLLSWTGRAIASLTGAALAASTYYQLSASAPWEPEFLTGDVRA